MNFNPSNLNNQSLTIVTSSCFWIFGLFYFKLDSCAHFLTYIYPHVELPHDQAGRILSRSDNKVCCQPRFALTGVISNALGDRRWGSKNTFARASFNILLLNKLIPTANDIEESDEIIMGRMFTVAKNLAKEEGIAEQGYRLIMNCNQHGGQEVYHMHMHLVGGQPLGKMLNI